MDKKKVIENLKQVELYINKLQGLDYTQLQLLKSAIFRLHDAQDELKKSDWISVEDELPSIYEDGIIVCNEDFPNNMRFAHRIPGKKNSFMDSSNFIRDEYSLPVTHWRKIDKLEV